MPTTVALVNPKGGSGKTTIAVHFAVTAHRDGQATTLLDADPQGSASDWHHRTPEGYDGPMVRFNARIPEALRDAFSDLCERKGWSMSSVVKQWMIEAVKEGEI